MPESKSDSLPNLNELPESSRAIAWERYQILRPHLEDSVPLRIAIADAEIPLRTAQRWVANYKKSGLAGLLRSCTSSDKNQNLYHLTREQLSLIDSKEKEVKYEEKV